MTVKRKCLALTALALAALLLAAAAGCGGSGDPAREAARDETSGDRSASPGSATPSATVTVNGRSVMGAWMEHWGYDWGGPVEKKGYSLDYRELDGSALPSSFAENVNGLEPGSVVFFKFCFVDFDGSNLAARETEIEEVVDTARELGLKLIIGNALPMHEADSDPSLLREYRDFNAFIEETAEANPDVRVFDFYEVLAGIDGWLKPEYDVGDSHLNEEAYGALDPKFFALLEEVFAR